MPAVRGRRRGQQALGGVRIGHHRPARPVGGGTRATGMSGSNAAGQPPDAGRTDRGAAGHDNASGHPL